MSKFVRIIIPIHEFNAEVESRLKDAIASVPKEEDVDFVVSCPKSIADEIAKVGVEVVSETESSCFQDLVNQAVDEDYKYFSVLEFDDAINTNWYSNVKKYDSIMGDGCSVMLTISDFIDDATDRIVKIGNEIAWWNALSSEESDLGYISFDSLSSYGDYLLSGGVFLTKDFVKVGKLKRNIPCYFWLEYMLRATFNGQKIFVIPKVCYSHIINRKGSLSSKFAEIKENDLKEYKNLAKREYLYTEDREIIFEE